MQALRTDQHFDLEFVATDKSGNPVTLTVPLDGRFQPIGVIWDADHGLPDVTDDMIRSARKRAERYVDEHGHELAARLRPT